MSSETMEATVERFQSHESVLDHVWNYFEEAAVDPEHPGRTPTFGSAGPDVRTVVLRRAVRETRTLDFHTDARSGKLDQLVERPDAVWHHWDPERSQQFRLYGQVTVHQSDDLADDFWEELSGEEQGHYLKEEAPGSLVNRPRSSHPETDPVAEPPESPRERFAVVRTVVDRIDWLHLHPEGHYRAIFEWNAGGFQGEWVVP